ncbi:MAG: hypothetical protein JWQ42_4917 [Edaphobacter sp.]|nr:hypothetical protein [Edaphobacter sp.]
MLNHDGSRTYSHTDREANDLFYDIRDMFIHVIGAITPETLPEPDLCSTGLDREGTLYRFRWFNALNVGGKRCGFGANLHSRNAIGGMWLIATPKLSERDTPELHPFKDPKIPNKAAWTTYLYGLVRDGVFDKKMKKFEEKSK